MIVRDVNNYIGVYEDNEREHEHIKLKGDYEVDKEYHKDPMFMYESIVNNVKEYIVPNKDFIKIIPNGTSNINVREYIKDKLLFRDGFHLSYQFGRFLAGLTAVMAITGKDISKVKFHPAEIDEATIEIYKKCVVDAINKPLEVTRR